MLTFIDGPAQGQVLLCARAPLFLRVVQDSVGDWDALDQLTDRPSPFERIEVYQLAGQAGSVHYCGRNTKTGRKFGRTEMTGDYRYVAVQPSDQIKREQELWQAWAVGQKRILDAARDNGAPVSKTGITAGGPEGVASDSLSAGVEQDRQDDNGNPGGQGERVP